MKGNCKHISQRKGQNILITLTSACVHCTVCPLILNGSAGKQLANKAKCMSCQVASKHGSPFQILSKILRFKVCINLFGSLHEHQVIIFISFNCSVNETEAAPSQLNLCRHQLAARMILAVISYHHLHHHYFFIALYGFKLANCPSLPMNVLMGFSAQDTFFLGLVSMQPAQAAEKLECDPGKECILCSHRPKVGSV